MKANFSKMIALLLAVAMLAMCVAGCGGNQSTPSTTGDSDSTKAPASNETEGSNTDEEITITFWHTYGDSEEAQFLNVVMPLWEAAHPNIKVEAVRQDSGQFHQMIVTSFGTGMSPDVARVDIANIAAYAEQGGLVALSDYEDFAELSQNYLEAPLSTNLYQGKYYGLPLDTNCKAAVINMNILKELGLDEVPATMEEFIEAAKDRGTYSLNVSGVGDWDMYPYFWLFGGTLTDEGFTQATGYLDKLVMDLVVNHSSDEHAWFVESRKSKDNPYRDYYIWRDGNGEKEPNNWASFFTPSAWSYDENTDQWYLHLFSEKQPDLNWENPKLRDEVYDMMNRWFDKGVDGFRMDVISLIAKAPRLPDGDGKGYVFSDQYFAFQPKLHEYLREMRERCFDGRDCMCVGETTFVTTENANSVVGDGRELDLLFQFDMS